MVLKNWRKEGAGKVLFFVKRTTNEFGGRDIKINIFPYLYPAGLRWELEIYSTDPGSSNNRRDIVLKTFRTKTQALKVAKGYMKKH